MREIVVDRLQVGSSGQMGEKLLAHVHQGRGAARREVEPPDQFLAARLGRLVQGIDGDRAGIAAIGVNRRLELGPVGTEAIRERREERQARRRSGAAA